MVSKKVYCAHCQKKCSGNVLRYQDQYYHKHCFELEQSESLARQPEASLGRHTPTSGGAGGPELRLDSAARLSDGSTTVRSSPQQQHQQQQPHLQPYRSPTASSGRSVGPTSASPQQHQHQPQQQPQQASQHQQRFLGADSQTANMAARASESPQPNGRPRAPARTPTPAESQRPSRSATLPHSISTPANGFLSGAAGAQSRTLDHRQAGGEQLKSATSSCAGCGERIVDGQALIALDLHWHVWCFKCAQCRAPLHGEYVAKGGKAYCEKDYQRLFGITCVYCKRYITGKVLQAGEAHHFHPSCARCSKCGDPFVPGEEMYLQGEVTWHPRGGPGPTGAESSLLDAAADERHSQLRHSRAQSPSFSAGSRSRSASPFSYMSRQYGRASPAYPDSEAVGDLSRIYTISYLNDDPNQGYLRRPLEPYPPKSPQFSRPTSLSRLAPGDRSRCSSRSQQISGGASGVGGVGGSSAAGSALGGRGRERSVPRGMYGVLSSMRSGSSSVRARSPSMMNEEAIQLAAYPSGQKPAPDAVAKIERDDFPAPPFPYPERGHAAGAAGHQRSGTHRRRRHTNGRAKAADGADAQQADQRRQLERQERQEHQEHQERASRPRSREIPVELLQARANERVRNANDKDNNGRLDGNEHEHDDDDDYDDDDDDVDDDDDDSPPPHLDPQSRKEEEELSKIANGIGKIFLQTLKERERLRAWKRANLDPRNASRTPSATRELPSRMRYENPANASPSRDMDRPRPWDEELDGGGDHSPTRTRSSLGPPSGVGGGAASANGTGVTSSSAISSSYGYKVVQANRSTPRPGYGLTSGPYAGSNAPSAASALADQYQQQLSFAEQQRIAQARAIDLLGRQAAANGATPSQLGGVGGAGAGSTLASDMGPALGNFKLPNLTAAGSASQRSLASSTAHFRRSMPNVASLRHLHQDGPPKLYPYHLLATSNYRLPPDVDRCHLERHLSNEEFQYIFHCDRFDFYRLPEWKRNELKRRARLF